MQREPFDENGEARPLTLVAKKHESHRSVVRVRGVEIGGRDFVVMAGPCAVESESQLLRTADAVANAGARVLRGGAFKPRTSPYSFQGLGVDGLRLLRKASQATGLPVVTEAMSAGEVGVVAEYADMLQIGTRNMQNYELLDAAARSGRPILLKRGMAARISELLAAAEFLMAAGNRDVILCERGIRTFEDATRYTLDISAVVVLGRRTHLPVVVDPSHAAGNRELVPALCRIAVASGADGLLVEVHPAPEKALSDGTQSLTLGGFRSMMAEIEPYIELRQRGRSIPQPAERIAVCNR